MLVDRRRVVAVKPGHWSNERQDWLAVLVLDTGTTIETQTWMKDAAEELGWRDEDIVRVYECSNKPAW